MLDMRRREFITLIGGAGLAWPLGARAQQDGSISRIGILWPGASLPAPPRMEAFRQGLRDLGFIDGQNVIIELRYAQGGVQQLPELAAELVRLKIDVIQASGDLAPRIAQQATTTVPIVAMSGECSADRDVEIPGLAGGFLADIHPKGQRVNRGVTGD